MLSIAPLSLAALLNAAPAKAAPVAKPDANAALLAQLCGARPACTISERKALESTRKNELVEWVTLQIASPNPGDEPTMEFWRTVVSGGKLTERQLFSRYQDTGAGYQSIQEVKPDQVKMMWSQFRSIDTTHFTVGTSTLRIRSQEESHHWPAGGPTVTPPFFHAQWDWMTLSGNGTRDNVHCDKPGKIQPADTRKFIAIPRVDLPSAFIESGWKRTQLGTCALNVGAKGSEGFLLAGEPLPGSQMKVLLASDRVLFVELSRTTFTQGLSNWLHGDHLEVWLSTPLPKDGDEDTAVGAEQWGISLPSGKVTAAAGEPAKAIVAAVSVRPATAGTPASTLIRIELPRPVTEGTTLAVNLSLGGGEKVKTLLSTSEVCFGSGTSLGLVAHLPADGASCKVEAGSLIMKQTEPLKAAEPYLDSQKGYRDNGLKAVFLP